MDTMHYVTMVAAHQHDIDSLERYHAARSSRRRTWRLRRREA